MQKREAIRKIRITFWVQMAITAAIVAIFETGLLQKNCIDLTPTTRYIADVAGIMLTIALIPLAIKGFGAQMQKAATKAPTQFIEYYHSKSNARLSILFFVTVGNLALHYGTGNNSALYCALFGIVATIYCYPTENALNNYTQEENN